MAHKSTTVRLIRIAARISIGVSPRLAARWLERLFLSPSRRPPPPRERRWLAGARREWLRLDVRRRIRLYSWGGAERPVILLAHGWSGRGSQMGAFVEPLVARGFRVVAFDAPAHGQSEGKLTGLPEFALAIERVARHVGPLHGIVAHSLGTAAATIAVARGLAVERLVYVAPPDNPGRYLYRAARYAGFGDGVAQRTQALIEQRFVFSFAQARGTMLARNLAVPLRVLHDEEDKQVPFAEGQRLTASWPGAELIASSGHGHNHILRDPKAVEQAVAFIVDEPLVDRARREPLAGAA